MDLVSLNISNHCLDRMRERKISPKILFCAIEKGEKSRKNEDIFVFKLGRVNVIVDVKKYNIITCWRDEKKIANKEEYRHIRKKRRIQIEERRYKTA